MSREERAETAPASRSAALQWPRGWHYFGVGLLALAFATYGSLVPLDFRSFEWSALSRRIEAILAEPASGRSKTDWVVNVLLFVPIGFCFLGALCVAWPRRAASLLYAPVVLLACAPLSLGIEIAQLWFPRRNASIWDVAAQSAGTLVGIVAWSIVGRRLHDWLRTQDDHKDYFRLVLWGYAAAFAIYTLLPFNFAISPAQLWDKHKEGRVVLRPFSEYRNWTGLVLDSLSQFLAVVPIGMLAAVIGTTERRPLRSWGSALALALLFVVGLFGVQLLVVGQPTGAFRGITHASDLITGLAGAVVGVVLMHYLRRGAGDGSLGAEGEPGFWLPLGLAAVYAVGLFFYFCVPFDIIGDPAVIKQRLLECLGRTPLESLYKGSPFNAAKEVVRKVGLFAPLGALLAASVLALDPSEKWRRWWLALAVAGGAGVGLAIEVCQLVIRRHIPDLTDVGLYAAGAAIGVLAVSHRARKKAERR